MTVMRSKQIGVALLDIRCDTVVCSFSSTPWRSNNDKQVSSSFRFAARIWRQRHDVRVQMALTPKRLRLLKQYFFSFLADRRTII